MSRISDVGILRQLNFNAPMKKSLFTPEQEALQRVLQQLRHAANLRQEDVADRLDEPQSFVSKYESGERRLDLIELRQICEVFGVSLLELVKRFEEQLQTCSQTKNSSDFPNRSGPTSER